LIEQAYGLGAEAGVAVWCEDEAGPFQAVPQPGSSWPPEGHPATQPHEWIRGGTTKLMTLFEPATGTVDVQPAASATNTVLHGWLKKELDSKLATLPPALAVSDPEANRAQWAGWQEGLQIRFTLPADLPPLRALLVWDNLAGHKTAEMVLWLCAHGIMPLYTPLGESWLNMAESMQRILKRRALAGQYAENGEQIGNWLQAVATCWNEHPTPFVWGGPRHERRQRCRERNLHRLGGSGACVQRFPSARNSSFHGK
jgi:DDE superfamily endonuclease